MIVILSEQMNALLANCLFSLQQTLIRLTH